MTHSNDDITCDVCGKPGARLRHVTRTYGEGDDLLVIENIPMISCPNCGESYFTAETLHHIEQIKQNRKQLAEVRPIEVAQFS
jgi:YgiT-type zinc finger domain-containing protein